MRRLITYITDTFYAMVLQVFVNTATRVLGDMDEGRQP